MADLTVRVAPGDDLFRLAARIYGDAAGWLLIAQTNGLVDPVIAADGVLTMPPYRKSLANDGAPL